MNAASETVSSMGPIPGIIFAILALVGLYYLYIFLFTSGDLVAKSILTTVKPANPDKPYITSGDGLPVLYEGGEFSINTWIYINDYAVNRGLNKPILTLGGSSFLTLAVYLGPYKNSLQVRVHSKSSSPVPPAGDATNIGASQPDDLSIQNVASMFGVVQQDNGLLNGTKPCDISSIDMQKWVQVTVCLNNKTCDVYIDGKMARSCVLPSFYRVDKSNLALNLCGFSGYGGFISNTSAYSYSLNPEQVWRLYMTGPGTEYNFLDYIKSLFNPDSVGSMTFPKQNITP